MNAIEIGEARSSLKLGRKGEIRMLPTPNEDLRESLEAAGIVFGDNADTTGFVMVEEAAGCYLAREVRDSRHITMWSADGAPLAYIFVKGKEGHIGHAAQSSETTAPSIEFASAVDEYLGAITYWCGTGTRGQDAIRSAYDEMVAAAPEDADLPDCYRCSNNQFEGLASIAAADPENCVLM